LLKKKKKNSDYVLACPACGFEKPFVKKEVKIPDEIQKKKEEMHKLMYMTQIKEEDGSAQNPVTTVVCPRCKHNKAEYFQLQTRSADEPATTFYQCMKCGKRWRDYA
jgi:transcription factor S